MQTTEDVTNAVTNAKQLVITRIFNVRREMLWKAWTDPEQLKRWFGPKSFTVPVCSVDLRVDGGFHLAMRSPDGKDYWVKGVFREIQPPERLVYADYFSDKDGNVVSPTEYGMSADFPKESLVAVHFLQQGDNTRMIVQFVSPASKEREQAEAGWNESFDKLAMLLAF